MSDNEEVVGNIVSEKWTGTIQCNECDYWGEMEGWVNPESDGEILFLCPECKTFERVTNPFS